MVVTGNESILATSAAPNRHSGSNQVAFVFSDEQIFRQDSALIRAKVGVALPQHQGGNAAVLEFLAQSTSQGERDILFQQRAAERFTAIVATVTGIHHRKVTTRGGWV